MDKILLEKLTAYLENNPEVKLAFWFGSRAKNQEHNKSDLDILISLKNPQAESKIWQDLGRIAGQEIDLINTDRAPASLISNALKTGVPLTIKDKNLYWDLYLEKTMEAEDFAKFVVDYWKIYQRSQSLNPEDRVRLIERLEFLTAEIKELERFSKIGPEKYEDNKPVRREMERWSENIINALIDIAKIIMASQNKPIPKTYEDSLKNFAELAGLSPEEVLKISTLARLRNILAHEYLEIIYEKIRAFIKDFPEIWEQLNKFINNYLKE